MGKKERGKSSRRSENNKEGRGISPATGDHEL
jgi:hypothetical protein